MKYAGKVNPFSAPGLVAVLFVILLFGSMTLTILFPFLPKLVKSFGVSEVEIGFYAGIIGSSFYAGRSLCSILWGYMVDWKGKKFTLILTLTTLTLSTIGFGLTRSFAWAFITRFLQGCFLGLGVVIISYISDICDDTNRPLGMTLVMSACTTGIVIGQSLGAFLAFPVERYPKVFRKGSIFDQFVILLPNMVLAVCFVLMIVLAIYVLPPDKKVIKTERETLLKDKDNAKIHCKGKDKQTFKNLVRNKNCLLSFLLYLTTGIVNNGFDEMFPVLAATTHEYGGFDFSPANIGTTLLIMAFATILVVTTVGTKMFIYCVLLQSICFPILPLLSNLSNGALFWLLLMTLMTTIRLCSEETSIVMAVFMNNSVENNVRGMANGLGITGSSLGRMIGPSLFGGLYSWSLTNKVGIEQNHHAIGFPFNQFFVFFLMSITGTLNAIMVTRFPDSINVMKK
ncbi:uncharacterized protein LOC130662323 isoform X2 [Hydractinia symbiolongicarpus]|uniref:uncharacterized protein LOC130662323 isoform X2 n=1 Tax=Hydractinia symbiolongicarpus TaxID=13093 RepID=UPI00255187BF|nr:uncharacterized protein LOC130662323 isoform X2 [Hydractinia symbiolongicarpus]